jgi:hypothetical protein
MSEYVARFFVGGIVVSAFAMLGDLLRPQSFAGLFGAAPSVALATLGLALMEHGADYAAVQTMSMISGAVALICCSVAVCQLSMRFHWRALGATMFGLIVWVAVALCLQLLAGVPS